MFRGTPTASFGKLSLTTSVKNFWCVFLTTFHCFYLYYLITIWINSPTHLHPICILFEIGCFLNSNYSQGFIFRLIFSSFQLCSPGATGFCITCSVSYDSCREDKISESNYCRPQGGQGSSSSPLLRPARALFPGAETSLTSSFFIAPFLLDGQDLSVCSRCSPLHPIQG